MMSELRKAEAEAKAGRRALWTSLPTPTPSTAAVQAQQEKDRKFEAIVTRVWGADTLSVLKKGDTVEKKIQFASVRQPR